MDIDASITIVQLQQQLLAAQQQVLAYQLRDLQAQKKQEDSNGDRTE
jgi:hypothetical protein